MKKKIIFLLLISFFIATQTAQASAFGRNSNNDNFFWDSSKVSKDDNYYYWSWLDWTTMPYGDSRHDYIHGGSVEADKALNPGIPDSVIKTCNAWYNSNLKASCFPEEASTNLASAGYDIDSSNLNHYGYLETGGEFLVEYQSNEEGDYYNELQYYSKAPTLKEDHTYTDSEGNQYAYIVDWASISYNNGDGTDVVSSNGLDFRKGILKDYPEYKDADVVEVFHFGRDSAGGWDLWDSQGGFVPNEEATIYDFIEAYGEWKFMVDKIFWPISNITISGDKLYFTDDFSDYKNAPLQGINVKHRYQAPDTVSTKYYVPYILKISIGKEAKICQYDSSTNVFYGVFGQQITANNIADENLKIKTIQETFVNECLCDINNKTPKNEALYNSVINNLTTETQKYYNTFCGIPKDTCKIEDNGGTKTFIGKDSNPIDMGDAKTTEEEFVQECACDTTGGVGKGKIINPELYSSLTKAGQDHYDVFCKPIKTCYIDNGKYYGWTGDLLTGTDKIIQETFVQQCACDTTTHTPKDSSFYENNQLGTHGKKHYEAFCLQKTSRECTPQYTSKSCDNAADDDNKENPNVYEFTIGDDKACVLEVQDYNYNQTITGNSAYNDDTEYTQYSNDYCNISCAEELKFTLPERKSSIAGQYFKIGDLYEDTQEVKIKGTKTCRANVGIDRLNINLNGNGQGSLNEEERLEELTKILKKEDNSYLQLAHNYYDLMGNQQTYGWRTLIEDLKKIGDGNVIDYWNNSICVSAEKEGKPCNQTVKISSDGHTRDENGEEVNYRNQKTITEYTILNVVNRIKKVEGEKVETETVHETLNITGCTALYISLGHGDNTEFYYMFVDSKDDFCSEEAANVVVKSSGDLSRNDWDEHVFSLDRSFKSGGASKEKKENLYNAVIENINKAIGNINTCVTKFYGKGDASLDKMRNNYQVNADIGFSYYEEKYSNMLNGFKAFNDNPPTNSSFAVEIPDDKTETVTGITDLNNNSQSFDYYYNVPENNNKYYVDFTLSQEKTYYSRAIFYRLPGTGEACTTCGSELKNYLGPVFPVYLNRLSGDYKYNFTFTNLGYDFDGGNSGRLDRYAKPSGSGAGYSCYYHVDNDVVTPDDPHDEDTFKQNYFYRVISLNALNPQNRSLGKNWNTIADGSNPNDAAVAAKAKKTIDEINEKNDQIYNEEADYEFVLTPSNMQDIRAYNQEQEKNSNGYQDFSLIKVTGTIKNDLDETKNIDELGDELGVSDPNDNYSEWYKSTFIRDNHYISSSKVPNDDELFTAWSEVSTAKKVGPAWK